jgi:hypothetical protein
MVSDIDATDAQKVVDEIREECREVENARLQSPVLSPAWALGPLAETRKYA